MIVTAWNNGQPYATGAGYGLKISRADRDLYFRREWKSVFVVLEGETRLVEINIAKASLWGSTCRELISAEVGRWLIKNGLAPWPKGQPPELTLEPMEKPGYFQLRKSSQ